MAGKADSPVVNQATTELFVRKIGDHFDLQLQPQPEDFDSSCLIITPASPQAAHFLGLHLPSLVAPHFSHLNIAIEVSLKLIDYSLLSN